MSSACRSLIDAWFEDFPNRRDIKSEIVLMIFIPGIRAFDASKVQVRARSNIREVLILKNQEKTESFDFQS